MPPPDAWQFEAIGTAWQIDTATPLDDDIRTEVLERIDEFDRVWSRFRADSLVSEMATRSGSWEVPDAEDLLGFYDELYEATNGAINPLVGRALADLGYDPEYSLAPTDRIAEVPSWESVTRSGSTVKTSEPVLIDVGAAGKGLLVDLLQSLLQNAGRNAYTIDASGDIYHHNPTPMSVALEHPGDPTRAIGVVELEPKHALCGSATNRRAWGDGLHHVLDGRTGRPTTEVVATWVIVPRSCMRADGLATALFLAEPAQLMPRFTYEFVRMHANGRVEWSPQFPGEVFA